MWNLFDSASTYYLVEVRKVAEEANPVMRCVMNYSWGTFFLTKMALVSLACWWFWRNRREILVHVGVWILFGIYSGLMLCDAYCFWATS